MQFYGRNTQTRLVKPTFYIGLAVGLPVFSNYFDSCSNCSFYAGKGHIKELARQIVYLAFSLFVSLIS